MLDDDLLKKITGNFNLHEKINIGPPEIHIRRDPYLDEAMRKMARENAEKKQREKDQVELLRNLLDIAKENPAVQQHIETLVQNSGTIHNMQNIGSGATGVQNVTNNTGLQAEEVFKLLDAMREFTDVLHPKDSIETREVIDDIQNEVQQPQPRTGRIKASLAYLKSLFTEIVGDPSKRIAAAQFTQYANEKAPEIVSGIQQMIETLK